MGMALCGAVVGEETDETLPADTAVAVAIGFARGTVDDRLVWRGLLRGVEQLEGVESAVAKDNAGPSVLPVALFAGRFGRGFAGTGHRHQLLAAWHEMGSADWCGPAHVQSRLSVSDLAKPPNTHVPECRCRRSWLAISY
jgi:hypothetical protein